MVSSRAGDVRFNLRTVAALATCAVVASAAGACEPTEAPEPPAECAQWLAEADALEAFWNAVPDESQTATETRAHIAAVRAACTPATTTTTETPTTTVPETTTTTETPPEGFPTPQTVGLPGGWEPTEVHEGDLTIDTPDTVLKGVLVTGVVHVRANGVIIRDSWIDGVDNQPGHCGWQFTITDSQIGAPGDLDGPEWGIGCGNYTAARNAVYAHDGFRNSGDHVLIEDNYFLATPDLSAPDPHYDGFQGYGGGADVTIRHNTLDQRPLGGDGVNAQIFLADGALGGTFTDNLLLGAGFNMKLNDDDDADPTIWTATGNRFVSVDGWGNLSTYQLTCGDDLVWSDNRNVTIDADYNVTSTGPEVDC